MHKILVNSLGGLSLPRKSVVRLTDRPDTTLDVYCGRKPTIQQQQQFQIVLLFEYRYTCIEPFSIELCFFSTMVETSFRVGIIQAAKNYILFIKILWKKILTNNQALKQSREQIPKKSFIQAIENSKTSRQTRSTHMRPLMSRIPTI